jgi:uncharacterized protein (DUF362 family)
MWKRIDVLHLKTHVEMLIYIHLKNDQGMVWFTWPWTIWEYVNFISFVAIKLLPY